MGFWSTLKELKEKFAGKKTEQTNTVLPTLQDIDKGNSELNNIETKTVESIINAPVAPQTTPQDNVMPSMGPSPEGLPLSAAGQTAAPRKKKAARRKPAKKSAPGRKTVKKAVKKSAPRRKPAKKAQKKSSKKRRR